MNLTDFIQSLPITNKTYDETIENGLTNTITNMMVNGLNKLDILEKSKNTKGTMYESVDMFSHQLKINEKLMDLHNPNLSEMMKMEIEDVITQPKNTRDKSKFLTMYNMDILGNSIPNVENWLIQVFTTLMASKK
jgi:hypothetical protein